MPALTIEDVRTYMRDFEERNDLLERKEYTDPEVENAMLFAVERFNIIPPLIGDFRVASFPNRWLLLKGTTAHLLQSEAIAQNRNQLSYTDSGVHVSVDDKAQMYTALSQAESAEFERLSSDYKMKINAEAAFGGAASPYVGLPTF